MCFAYGLMCTVHFKGLFLGWSILFLVFFAMQKRSRGEFLRQSAIGLTGSMIPVLLLVVLIVGHMLYYHYDLRLETYFQMVRFDPGDVSSSLGGSDGHMFKADDYPGGTLSYWFSWRHARDVLKFYMLVAPFAIFILAYILAAALRTSGRFPPGRALFWFLLVLNLSYYQITFIWARDGGWYGGWDFCASIGMTLNLMGGMVFLTLERDARVVRWIGSIVIAVGMVRTAAWIVTNHSLF